MQTVSEIAQHLNDVMSKENLAVAIVEDGNRISLRAIHSAAVFDMERAADGGFLVGFPPMSGGGWWTQVTNGPRENRDPDKAVIQAVSWMRRF
jgi:hypothetical protein